MNQSFIESLKYVAYKYKKETSKVKYFLINARELFITKMRQVNVEKIKYINDKIYK